jgi:hypothetical protein
MQLMAKSADIFAWRRGLKTTVVEESAPDELVVIMWCDEFADQEVEEFVQVRFKAITLRREE